MSAKTTGRTIKFTVDPKRPPRLGKHAKMRLASIPEERIDLTDIPATHGVAWQRQGTLIPTENKQQVTLRIDADVLAFFKTTGRRYQTRMNEVLRSYMKAQNGVRRAARSR
jgi:uncharacterized protein (DUF4415 family)